MNIASDIPVAQPAAGGLLQDDAALQGLAELMGKLEPLLAGRRLNRVVDLLSATADLVDMADDYMVEKVAKAFEDGVGGAWAAGNAARMAAADAAAACDSWACSSSANSSALSRASMSPAPCSWPRRWGWRNPASAAWCASWWRRAS